MANRNGKILLICRKRVAQLVKRQGGIRDQKAAGSQFRFRTSSLTFMDKEHFNDYRRSPF